MSNPRIHLAPRHYPSPLCDRTSPLTPREIEVVELSYLSNSDIGQVLGISVYTVKAHLRQIFLKLNVETRTAAALVAVEKVAA